MSRNLPRGRPLPPRGAGARRGAQLPEIPGAGVHNAQALFHGVTDRISRSAGQPVAVTDAVSGLVHQFPVPDQESIPAGFLPDIDDLVAALYDPVLPEADAVGRMYKCAEDNGIAHPSVIGWDFPRLSQEQVNVFNMHGYTAALILPEDVTPEGYEIREQPAHLYAAIHIDRPFDNPFATIPGAYHTLYDYMRTNGLARVENEVIPCFETDGESMDVYIACR